MRGTGPDRTNDEHRANSPARGRYSTQPTQRSFARGQHRTVQPHTRYGSQHQTYDANRSGSRNRHLHTLDEQCDYGENTSQCDYDDYTSHANELSFNVVDTSISRRNKAYATLKIQLCNRPGIHNFRLKVDTGA